MKKIIFKSVFIIFISVFVQGCAIPSLTQKKVNNLLPNAYQNITDTTNTAHTNWRTFFKDDNLIKLIDTALSNNQTLNITLQNIQIAQNEIRARKGTYLPFVNGIAGMGVDKASQYTRFGALDANNDIETNRKNPVLLPDFMIGVNVSWQVDIWRKLRNSKQVATLKYLASIEGKNFLVTTIVAQVAHSYYTLLALDSQLDILQKNIEIQENALKMINLEKTAGQVTELAVRRFQAEVNKNKSYKYFIQQQIIEEENKINFLLGRYPKPIVRTATPFTELKIENILGGVPAQLLQNRPDIKQAEYILKASQLDIKIARANFFPNVNINSNIGYEAFNPKYLLQTPQSLLFNLVGGLVTPMVNRNAIKAEYFSANARQIQAAFEYERTILNAYTEVYNQMTNLKNLSDSYNFKTQQVNALSRSVDIVINLFKSARADYVEILLTQRDALESKMDLIDIKQKQMNATINMYQALGGGWR